MWGPQTITRPNMRPIFGQSFGISTDNDWKLYQIILTGNFAAVLVLCVPYSYANCDAYHCVFYR